MHLVFCFVYFWKKRIVLSNHDDVCIISTQILKRIRDRRRTDLPPDEKARLEAEDERDRTWWKELEKEEDSSKDAEDEGLESRKSGTKEWKEARGEAGK